MTITELTRDQKNLLLYLETCAVDQGGRIDSRHISKVETEQCMEWAKEDYIQYGRIKAADGLPNKTTWVELSGCAWDHAAQLRKERGIRNFEKRSYKRTSDE